MAKKSTDKCRSCKNLDAQMSNENWIICKKATDIDVLMMLSSGDTRECAGYDKMNSVKDGSDDSRRI